MKGPIRKPSTMTRRTFIKAASVTGLAAVPLLADTNEPAAKNTPSQISPKDPILSRIRIGQIKVYPEKGEMEANHDKLFEVLFAMEKECKVDVVITPEGFLDGYVSTKKDVARKDMARYAIDPAKSRYTKAVSDWAGRNKTWFIYGCTRKSPAGIFNTALIFDRQGKPAGTYDKLHLQKHDLKYTPGKHLHTYESDFGKFGVMICADRRWPETVRSLTLQGARIIMNPTYGMHGELNLCMMRTRAYENGIYIAFTHPGQSLITGPRGNIVCNNKDANQTFTVTEIDLSNALIDKSGHLRDRRVDVYTL